MQAKNKANSQEKISLSYCYTILRFLKVFFRWLSQQAGYKKIDKIAIDYLNLTQAENRIATQPRKVEIPRLEDIKAVIENIKGKSEIEMRDKALISLIFLTGARISAVMTLPMQSFDRDKLILDQDPKLGVKTKFSKRIVSTFIAFWYKEPINYFLEWFDYLKKQKEFKLNDPIFPATKIENGKENIGYYNTGEVEPIFWKSTSTPRKIFEKRFAQAGVKYYHPHTLRHFLSKEAIKRLLTEEQKKAISQNFGHADIRTTFGSYGYGRIDEDRQIEIIKNIDFDGERKEIRSRLDEEDIEQLADKISEKMKVKGLR
ncbi:MAG: site-specific integrase [bacterium]|nr:site-specific integrase [bacterium]